MPRLQIFKEAQELLPGGVNSPVRAFKSVGGQPIVFDHVKVRRGRRPQASGRELLNHGCDWVTLGEMPRLSYALQGAYCWDADNNKYIDYGMPRLQH